MSTTQQSLIKFSRSPFRTSGLTNYVYPSTDGGFRDLYRSGWLPGWFNQQWGGSQWGHLPDGSFGSIATGNIQDDATTGIGYGTDKLYVSQGFKLSESMYNPLIWVKIYKVGNPGNLLNVSIYSDNGSGSPLALIGTADSSPYSSSMRRFTSKPDGEWYSFSPLPGLLTAGVQYHIVMSDGATDTSNFIQWKVTSNSKYPHGCLNTGTSAPAWTKYSSYTSCFLIQNPAINSLLQPGGQFDYKLSFNPGTPVNQSRSLAQPLVNFYDGKSGTALYRGTFISGSNVLDFGYGLDHDRITLTVNGSGYPVLTLYKSDRTAYTVTGTSSITSGSHDVGFKVRTVGDGSDYLYLYVDGASVGTPLVAQTFTMDKNLRDFGTARLGDGFGIIPTWTQDMQMTALPSTQGWTYFNNLVTEASAFSILNNKLYQNKTAFDAAGATSWAGYSKTVTLSNSVGWIVSAKLRIPTNTNTYNGSILDSAGGVMITVKDGTKVIEIAIQEYFLEVGGSGALDFTIQGDFKTQEHVFTLQGKGSDYYLFIDNKLVVDGTGKLTATSSTNSISFGDNNGNSGENADAIWSYIKYYTGGMILPVASANTCSEFVYWSGDMSGMLADLYNNGNQVPAKLYCGMERNYVENIVQKISLSGVATGLATTGTLLLTDLECYTFGSQIDVKLSSNVTTGSASLGVNNHPRIDGIMKSEEVRNYTPSNANYYQGLYSSTNRQVTLGMHKVEGFMVTGSGATAYSNGNQRSIAVEAKS